MPKLYNIGDSFSYGNCVQSYENFADNYKHLGPGDIISDELGYEHINLASPGLSPDGVLRRLYTTNFEEVDSFLLIGIPPENRFQTIGERPRDQHRDRSYYKGTEHKAKAFMNGPVIEEDWFRTHNYLSGRLKAINLEETLIYNSWFNILLIQKRLRELNLKFVIYNSVYGQMQYKTKLKELLCIKDQINYVNYFQPMHGIQDLVDSNNNFKIARDDAHPNHSCYAIWCKKILNFIKES
tara:strand:- start:30369 stop:31085 length:717 start_codon:yes stop_codon:yes gene_type:complete